MKASGMWGEEVFQDGLNNELTSDNFNPDPFLEKKSLYKTLSRDGSKIEL